LKLELKNMSDGLFLDILRNTSSVFRLSSASFDASTKSGLIWFDPDDGMVEVIKQEEAK